MGPQVRFCERLGGAIPRAYSAGTPRGESGGGKAIKRTVRPSVVIGLPPVLNDNTCFLHRRKLFTSQALSVTTPD